MTTESFSYWLQGYAEICGKVPTKQQWDLIKRHLDSCFAKDPEIHGHQKMIAISPIDPTLSKSSEISYCGTLSDYKMPTLDCQRQNITC